MVAEPLRAAGRWAQLTYASFDDGTAPGGWQVKETIGELSPVELEALRSRVVTAFGAAEPLPQFPTPAQIDALARRFTYAPIGTGPGWAYWHAAQAGSDASGRPGNVFSHVVLDRLPESASPAVRPVFAWRSSWLAPFGPQQVLSSAVSGNPALGTGPIRPETVVSFLTDPAKWRVGTFAVLLDAVRSALAGGPVVVLVTDAPESAAMWSAAVSLFMSAGTSRRFALSLFERAAELDGAIRRGLHLVAVPRADAGEVRGRDDVVVVDDLAEPLLGDPGGSPHVLGDGTTVPATRWSVLAQVALEDAPLALATLRAVDAVATEVGDVGLAPEWPLAMVVAAHGERLGDGELLDAADEAAEVLAEHSPVELRDHPTLLAATSAILGGRLGTDTAGAFEIADGGDAGTGLLPALAARAYAERALLDRSWLARTGPVPIPPAARGVADDGLRGSADVVLEAWVDRSRSSTMESGEPAVRTAVELLHLLDLLDGIGIAVADQDRMTAAEQLVETFVAPVLVSPSGLAIVERAGPVGRTVRALVREVTASMPEVEHRNVGNVLVGPVLAWLYADDDRIVPRPDGLLAPLDRERVISACRSGSESSVAALRHLAFVDVVHADRARSAASLDLGLRRSYEALIAGAPWTPDQITTVWRHQVAVPDEAVARAVGAASDTRALDELVALPLPGELARAAPLARLRAATQQLLKSVRARTGGPDVVPGRAATHLVYEIVAALEASGIAADDLATLPEIADPIVAAVALQTVSSIVPLNHVVNIVAERMMAGAGAPGVRAVLDLVIAEGVLPGPDTDGIAELFLRAESTAANGFAPHDRLRYVGAARLGTGSGARSLARVLVEAVLEVRPTAATSMVEHAARVVAAQDTEREVDEGRARKHGEEVARRLFARWLHDDQPTKTRSGLLGRLGRNEVN